MQPELFYETLNDAATAVVMALGGYKKVGAMLWPESGVEASANRLRDCLNSSRREVLHPDQVLFLMRQGKRAGCHSLAAFMMRDCGYADPQPIEPEDEKAELMRQFNASAALIQKIAVRLESLGGPVLKVAA